MDKPKLRRLIDLPGMADLETKALMKPAYAAEEHRADYPEIDACSTALFGLTADEAEATPRPADWDDVDRLPLTDQVDAFEAEGWDVRDAKRRPMRMLASSTSSSGWPSAASPGPCRSRRRTRRRRPGNPASPRRQRASASARR